MLKLPSSREEFQSFVPFYESEVEPFLAGQEEARKKAVFQSSLVGGAAAVLALLLVAFETFGELRFHVAFFFGFVGFAGAAWWLGRTRNVITHGLLSRVCRFLGMTYQRDLSRPAYFRDFDRLNMMPAFNRESWEDEVQGKRHEAEFVFCEAHLKYKTSGKNSSTRTVFHGQILVIDYGKEFLGETVIKRDAGILNRFTKPRKGFQKVGIASPNFEKIFEAWSTDQVEARDLLDPLVLERFEELDRLFNGAKLRAAFTKGKLIVAMEVGDKLNMGSMFQPLHGPERVEKILAEFDIIFDLIDVLLKRVEGRTAGAFSVADVRG